MWLRSWLMETGFLDAESEGSIAFWRWDYWNAHMAALIRADERRRWEGKRARTRAKWGEAAG
jgi:hypothetical protein